MIKKNIRLSILSIPRKIKRLIVMFVDGILSVLAVWIAFYLRVGNFIPIWERVDEHYILPAFIISILLFLPTFLIFRLYHTIFRYSGLYALIKVVKAIGIYSFFYFLIFTVIGIDGVPRTIGIIQPIIFFILISFSRFVALYWLGGMYKEELLQNKKSKTLIYGTGKEGRELMSVLMNNSKINVVGFLDEDPKFHGNQINNLTVYNPENISELIKKKKIQEIMLALPRESLQYQNRILQTLRGLKIKIRTIPSYVDLLEGKITVSDIRPLSIEDVLGRDPVIPDQKLMMQDIAKKNVLVTGAGGTIGKELCNQILMQKPNKLIIFDHSEFNLYTILEELKQHSSNIDQSTEIIPYLGSVTDKICVKNIFKETKPKTIFHAAAYKHVPLLERNVFEGIKNNIFGTLVLSQEAVSAKVEKFILISSDKAVRPSSIMGASKRISEMILQALSTTQKSTIFAMVRFGNVLDSSGSVVPLFKSQIKSGGPVTVTHEKMTRYFMTISEAAQLVIQASAMTKQAPEDGHASPIYLLDMGKPVKIYDLAKLMIELSGFTVFDKKTGKGDIKIKKIGIRPGEKLYEELLIGDNVTDSVHPRIKFAKEEFLSWPKICKMLEKLTIAINLGNKKLLKSCLNDLVFKIKK